MTAGRVGIAERDLQGLGRFRSLRKLLARLPKVGTRRDPAGNRQLPMDQYWGLVLLRLFNPAIRTLRGLQRTTEFEKLRKRLGVNRTSLGSLSESVRIFDPTRIDVTPAAPTSGRWGRRMPNTPPPDRAGLVAAAGSGRANLGGRIAAVAGQRCRLAGVSFSRPAR